MMNVSVIVPTYNRRNSLHELLISLSRQTYSIDQFEVIIVDDGSTDGTAEITKEEFPFALRYFWQVNKGDAKARNLAAQQSQAEFLVFLDDDMQVEPDYLAHLLPVHLLSPGNKIVVGTEYLWLKDISPLIHPSPRPQIPADSPITVEHPFPFTFSRNMCMKRETYIALGMMDDLGFSGSSIWCDVDFAYRAYCEDYQFLRSTRAICYHHDHVARSLINAKKRNWEAAYRAVIMLQKYPELLPHLPMFHDKTPINWSQDTPGLLLRKLMRPVASSRPVLTILEKTANVLEQHYASPGLLRPLRRWIIGAYTFKGYRTGLREFGSLHGNKQSSIINIR